MKSRYERLRKSREQMALRRAAQKQLREEVSDFFYGDYWPRPDEDDLSIDPGHWLWWDRWNGIEDDLYTLNDYLADYAHSFDFDASHEDTQWLDDCDPFTEG